VGVGLLAGLGVALLAAQALGTHLFEVSPHDPASIALAVATVLVCALVAIGVPARRAATADPAALLRRG
jgi:ABC-type antimicrobial peptide transport system permease subunit